MSVTQHKMDETTPLLPGKEPEPRKWGNSALYRALLAGFMISLSFAVTQVPMLYLFRVMTCDAYYEDHPEPIDSPDRCAKREIESGTARAISLLSTSTTLFGVINLLITTWSTKRIGVKSALAVQVFWPAVRLAVQNVGVMTGGNAGIIIIQCSQIITIIGGPVGYQLALNTMITEIVEAKDRTGALGRLQGCTMLGTAIGYLVGGVIGDRINIIAPFRITLILFLACTLYVIVFLPYIPKDKANATQTKKGGKFFGPLRIFAPQKWVLRDGRVQTEYGALLLGIGVFFGVLATGYIPVMLQMFSTDVLGFGPTENGELVSLHSLLRGLFLTLIFPRIIAAGRTWLERHEKAHDPDRESIAHEQLDVPQEPTASEFAAEVQPMEPETQPTEVPKLHDKNETFAFDLVYTRWSLIADGTLTGVATFVRQGWQIYVVAVMLSLASGTASAAKGTILQMCPSSDRPDALSAITLVEMMARLVTTTVFGLIFAAFAEIGKIHLVFACNAAVALLGFCILCLSRFPPDGSTRLIEDEDEDDDEVIEADSATA